MTLEELLRTHTEGLSTIETTGIDADRVKVRICPAGGFHPGETMDYYVTANTLRPVPEPSFIADYQADQ
jgi:hypothetical protein